MVKPVEPKKYFDEVEMTDSPLEMGKERVPAEKVGLERIKEQFHEKGDLKRVVREVKRLESKQSKVELDKLLNDCIAEKRVESKKIPLRLWLSSHFGQIHEAEELHHALEKDAVKEQAIYDVLSENNVIHGQDYKTEVKEGQLILIFENSGRAYNKADQVLNARFGKYRHYCEVQAAEIQIDLFA